MQKQNFLLLASLLTANTLGAQCNCCVLPTLEDLHQMGRIIIPTNGNDWQLGAAHKNIPIYNDSTDVVLITDTTNAYHANNQSVMYITDFYDDSYAVAGNNAHFTGVYFVESDSLRDYGTMHVSFDNKQTWLNLQDTAYAEHLGAGDTPVFTGKSGTWKPFSFNLGGLSREVGATMQTGDTVFIKLTFVADSITDTLAGWAIHNVYYCHTGIEQLQDNSLISIYPNPTQSTIYINRQETVSDESIEIFNTLGIKVWEQNAFVGNEINLHALGLPAGIYTLRYSNSRRFAVQRFVYSY